MMKPIRINAARRLLILALVFQPLVLTVDAYPHQLRRPSRELSEVKTSQRSVLLHLALEYVNETVAQQLQPSGTSRDQNEATRHFCDSVNEQAGGNQVATAAEDNGVTIQTKIMGTWSNPDFQCQIVYSSRIEGSAPESSATGSSQLFGLSVTVEQVVYVTTNRTITLGRIANMVQSGFNRGLGGRVRFRSLLRDHPMFATVANVEVLDGVLTRFPTRMPTSGPTHSPSQAPSILPTYLPTPTLDAGKTRMPTERPTAAPTMKPTPRPTDKPSNDDPPTNSVKHEDIESKSNDDPFDPLFIAAIAGGSIMILIACLCVLCLWFSSDKKNRGQDDKQGRSERLSKGYRPKQRSKNKESEVVHVPNMVQLDEENRSLANTTLGDLTAGGARKEKNGSFSYHGAQSKKGNEASGSFDDMSLFTTRRPAGASAQTTDSSKQNSNSTASMLPPSVMPYEDESLVFPTDNAHSDSASTGSGDPQSSLLSESFASSSLMGSDAYHGPVDLDNLDPSSQHENTLGFQPFTNYTKATEEKTEAGDTKEKKILHRRGSSNRIVPTPFSPFDTNETLQSVKLDFDKPSRLNTSFHSIEDGTAPSIASSASSLTKKAENLFFFGFQPPPEERKIGGSPDLCGEEEKREIEHSNRDEDIFDTLAGDDRDGDITQLPVDLLADNHVLERSQSPASWNSWTDERQSKRSANIFGFDETKSSASAQESRASKHTSDDNRAFVGRAKLETNGLDNFRLVSRNNDNNNVESEVGNGFSSKKIGMNDSSHMVATLNFNGHGRKLLQGNKVVGSGPSAFTVVGPRNLLRGPHEEENKESSPEKLEKSVVDVPKTENVDKKPLSAALVGLDSKAGVEKFQPVDVQSASSSSTGQNNPWLFEAVEQTLGPRSVTADLESLSGRSNRSGKSYRSSRSRQSHRSKSSRSNRSYNVPPSGKYKGRGNGRARSAAASTSSTERRSAGVTPLEPRKLERDLNKLEKQLAALQGETDLITASSITLSSIGGRTRSTRSSKLTHTGAKIMRKRRVIVEVPPGKLGVVLANRHDGKGTVVSEVRPDSSLKGLLSPGDKLVAIDGEDVQGLNVTGITEVMNQRHNMERLLTVITSMHQETKSVGTQ